MNTIYREEILEHYREPQNFGKLSKFDVSSRQLNPFCGDEIEIFIIWDKRDTGDKRDRKGERRADIVSFQGKGCAISIASASMLTEYAKTKTKLQLTKFSENDMLGLLGVAVSENRKKCALLALAVLKDCLI